MSAPSESFGPYRVLDVLGRGGMGVVYRGAHEVTGAEVAVKVVSAASAARIAAIRREIHALARVQHPGVVRVVDHGIAAGLPWYAMELVRGHTLREVLEEERRRAVGLAATAQMGSGSTTGIAVGAIAASGGVKRSFSEDPAPDSAGPDSAGRTGDVPDERAAGRALAICAALCEPLAVVHAAGLVHRDLKPENILVNDQGRPVLLDFGIASGFGGASGREVLAAAGDVVGTCEYMAPEQIRGDLVDARADLYGLGCILYECLVGHTPFAGYEVHRLLLAHREEAPIAPSRLGLRISRGLEALVMRLLAKRPADRIGHAEDVATTLRELGHGAGTGAWLPGSVHAYLYRAELIGRDDVMDRARAAIRGLCEDRRGGLILVGGESGVGKTRLGVEITREAARWALKVVTGQCAAEDRAGATPLRALRSLVREAPSSRGLSGALAGPGARVLAPYFPEIEKVPGFDRAPEPTPLPPDAARTRVLDAAEALLLEICEDEPVLLVLDDVHWADELSLALLGRFDADKLAARGLLCVGLYRAEEAGDALLALAGAAGVERWDLGRLDAASVGAMAAGMLAAAELPPAWAEMLARVSDGNPFFAGEYLRAAVEAGILARDGHGRWSIRAEGAARGEALSVPTTIEALLDARFERLGSEELRLLAAAAVLGRTLEGSVAAATAGMAERATLDAVSALVRRQILEETAGGRLRFVHDRLREAAYSRLGAGDRRALHAAAAQAIEAHHEGDPADFAALANHHAAAGRSDAAYWYGTLAAGRAESVYANEQAIALHRAALGEAEAGGAAPVRRVETASRLGDLLLRVGRAEEAREAYTMALAGVPSSSGVERARLHLAAGTTWETHQHHREALAAFDEAERCLGAAPGPDDEVGAFWQAWIQIGLARIQVHYWAADMEALTSGLAALEPVVERHGTDAQRASLFHTFVQRDLRGARYRTSPETAAYARRSLAASERGVDREQRADARLTLAAVLLWSDALEESEREMLAALEESEAIGSAWIRVASLAYLAVIARRLRDVDAARARSSLCLAAAEEAKLFQYAGVAEANLGWAQLEDDCPEEAERLCEAALERWRGLPLVYPFQWLARLPLCTLAMADDRPEEAESHARAMLEPTQQRLPEALEAALAGGRVTEAIQVAEALGYV